MFESLDYIVTTVIRDRLLFLSQNPHHAEFIFQGFQYPVVKEYLGPSYILEAIKFVTENAVFVSPAYQGDLAKKPALYIEHDAGETNLYLGDYGSSGRQLIVPPKSLVQFSISGTTDNTLKVSKDYDIKRYLKNAAVIKNNDFQSTVDSFYEDDDFSYITLKEAPPVLDFRGWHIMSAAGYRQCIVSSSTDSVSIRLLLLSNGDVNNHKLLRAIVKYAIKSSRNTFDSYGLQVSTVSVSPISISDPTDIEFQSQFTVSGKFTESWIEKEIDIPNELALCLVATSSNPGNDDVLIESDL
jgi:hypothetical protein